MYKLIKEAGNNACLTLINPTTGSSLMIGRLTSSIMDILKEDGKGDLVSSIKEKWELEVSDKAGKELASKALTMRKPIRVKPVEPAKETEQPKDNSKIDAMDVIFGLAKYNK